MTPSPTQASATVRFLEQRSGWLIAATLLLSALLLVPLFTMGTTEQASSEPSGEIFELRDEAGKRLPPRVYGLYFVAEANSGDFFTQAPLWELYQNGQELHRLDQLGQLHPPELEAQPYLYSGFDVDRQRPLTGLFSVADAVQEVLQSDPTLNTTLERATDDQVKLAVAQVMASPLYEPVRAFQLSEKASFQRRAVLGREIDYWTTPAVLPLVVADNDRLGGGSAEINLGADPTIRGKEQFGRTVQEVLRGDQQHYRLWGVAIDANLEGEDEGQEAGPFIMFTVIAVLLVVGISLRSYWAVALTGAGLGLVMLWLQGISNLIGLKSGLVIDLIVPIAMISLGVDYTLHALHRYREEGRQGSSPRLALHLGFAGVLGALLLAMLTDGIAFLSNAASGIEAVTGFGIAAGVAVGSAFIILGIVVPLAMMRLDAILGPPRPVGAAKTAQPHRHPVATIAIGAASIGAAVFAGVAIIALVAISKLLGVVLIFAFIILAVLLPFLILARRRRAVTSTTPPAPAQEATSPSPLARLRTAVEKASIEPVLMGLARRRALVLAVAAAVTAVSLYFAFQLEPRLDVQEFFDSNSDFVIGLDKIDEHVGQSQGEGAGIYIKGDLTNPQALAAIQALMERLPQNGYVAKNSEGEVSYNARTIFDVLRRLLASPYALAQVEAEMGVPITDANADGVPDSREQLRAAYDYLVQHGLPLDQQTLLYDAPQIRETLFHDPSGATEDATAIVIGIPGTREQSVVTAARQALEANLVPLNNTPGLSTALIGSPFTREASLSATTRTLNVSLPFTVAACLLLLVAVFRSIPLAVVTVIPIGLVVAWLYAFMELAGFHLNFVTATIAAVSVGVGIDYSIHVTQRFREELRKTSDRMTALRQVARGTGVALTASAASSVVGFAIMGFAPMPMFASFGVLTAIMIACAATAALLVLPSLLLLVTREAKPAPTAEALPLHR